MPKKKYEDNRKEHVLIVLCKLYENSYKYCNISRPWKWYVCSCQARRLNEDTMLGGGVKCSVCKGKIKVIKGIE